MTTFNNLTDPVRKNVCPLLLTLGLLLPVVAGAQLTNGSFELGLTGWTTNAGIALTLSTHSPGLPASQGTNALEFGYLDIPDSVLSQVVPVSGGTNYTLQFDIMALGYPGNTGVVRVDVDSAAGLLASQTFTNAARNTLPMPYQAQAIPFSVPVGVTAVTLRFVDLSPNGGIAVDPIIDNVRIDTLIPVTITNQPAQQVVGLGETATFSVGAYSYPAPYYQWTFNGAFLTNEIGTSLVITNVGTNQLGDYAAIVWNSFSVSTSSVAQLRMSPSIYAPFAGDTATWGKSATLSVSAVGSGDLSYQWFKDGVLVAWGTNASLAFPEVQIGDGGLYSVVVTSEWGSVTNTPALLVVNPANIALGIYAGVTIEGVVGYTYGIESSTNLTDTNSWVLRTNLTLTEPVQIWVDTSVDIHAPGVQRRFYRVVAP